MIVTTEAGDYGDNCSVPTSAAASIRPPLRKLPHPLLKGLMMARKNPKPPVGSRIYYLDPPKGSKVGKVKK